MPHRIEYTQAARRELQRLDRTIQVRIVSKIEKLAASPRGAGAVKLTGHHAYRVRVGDYRIIYAVLDDRLLVLIVEIGHRREIYRDW